MRLFIAIDLDENIKAGLEKIITGLKAETKKGSFTRRENLHLTLIFLGELDAGQINRIKKAMDAVQAAPFAISFSGTGYFKRNEGDLYWIGVDKNEMLNDIYEQLYSNLSQAGFALESRQFKPHLTIGRRIVANQGFNRVGFSQLPIKLQMKVEKISLMNSERLNAKLIYTEIYAKNL